MYKFETRIFINRSPQEIFDFVTNPANNAKWQSGTESAEWTSGGSPGIGSTFKIVTDLLGRKIEAVVEVTEWVPPYRSSLKTVSGPFPFVTTIELEEKDGGTLMTQTAQAEIGGVFKLTEGLVGKQLEKQIETSLAALKLELESDQVN